MWFEQFIGDFYDTAADKLQHEAGKRGLTINLIFDNYHNIKYEEAEDHTKLNVFIDFITYKIYRIEE